MIQIPFKRGNTNKDSYKSTASVLEDAERVHLRNEIEQKLKDKAYNIWDKMSYAHRKDKEDYKSFKIVDRCKKVSKDTRILGVWERDSNTIELLPIKEFAKRVKEPFNAIAQNYSNVYNELSCISLNESFIYKDKVETVKYKGIYAEEDYYFEFGYIYNVTILTREQYRELRLIAEQQEVASNVN